MKAESVPPLDGYLHAALDEAASPDRGRDQLKGPPSPCPWRVRKRDPPAGHWRDTRP